MRVFERLIAWYPADYRARFAAEMRAALGSVTRDREWLELTGLLRGLVLEWTAKLTADAAVRARHLPDCRKMRPAGVTRAEWGRGL